MVPLALTCQADPFSIRHQNRDSLLDLREPLPLACGLARLSLVLGAAPSDCVRCQTRFKRSQDGRRSGNGRIGALDLSHLLFFCPIDQVSDIRKWLGRERPKPGRPSRFFCDISHRHLDRGSDAWETVSDMQWGLCGYVRYRFSKAQAVGARVQ